MTAESQKIVAALQIGLPTAETRVVPKVHIAFQRLRNVEICPVIDACVLEHRAVMWDACWPHGLRSPGTKQFSSGQLGGNGLVASKDSPVTIVSLGAILTSDRLPLPAGVGSSVPAGSSSVSSAGVT